MAFIFEFTVSISKQLALFVVCKILEEDLIKGKTLQSIRGVWVALVLLIGCCISQCTPLQNRWIYASPASRGFFQLRRLELLETRVQARVNEKMHCPKPFTSHVINS